MEEKTESNVSNINKPLILALDDFKADLIKLINDARLPAYFLEPVFEDVHNKCKTQAQNELMDAKRQYTEAQKEKYTQDLEQINKE